MFLKNLYKITGKIGFRLTLWHSGLIITAVLTLYQASYYFLESTLKSRDIQEIQSETSELVSEFEADGLKGLTSFIKTRMSRQLVDVLFIRIMDDNNRPIFLFTPKKSEVFDYSILENGTFEENNWISLKSRNAHYTLDILNSRLNKTTFMQVGMSSEKRHDILGHFSQHFITGVAPLIIIGIIFSIFLSIQNLKPVRHIINTVETIDIGKMNTRVPRTGNGDELDELARLFNDMLDRIGHLIKGMKDSLDNVAHDLRTPLTRLRNTAENALTGMNDRDPEREGYENILEESERILRMLDTLMDISEAETGVMHLSKETKPLKDVMIPIYDLYSMVAESKQIRIELDVPDHLVIHADTGRISQVIANLLDNAVKFTPEYGCVLMKAYDEGDFLRITVSDTGAGIPEHDMTRIFDRLYRGDQSRSQKGLGLGLSLVKAIVSAHEGFIEVESTPGKGSHFCLKLPALHV